MKGAYVLLIKLDSDKKIKVGKLGKIFFKKGFYVYVGSALNGLEARLDRHKKTNKKFHWHIDYLLGHSKIIGIFYKEGLVKEECNIANLFLKYDSVLGFGSSDCKCKSHLFFSKNNEIIKYCNSLNFISYVI